MFARFMSVGGQCVKDMCTLNGKIAKTTSTTRRLCVDTGASSWRTALLN